MDLGDERVYFMNTNSFLVQKGELSRSLGNDAFSVPLFNARLHGCSRAHDIFRISKEYQFQVLFTYPTVTNKNNILANSPKVCNSLFILGISLSTLKAHNAMNSPGSAAFSL